MNEFHKEAVVQLVFFCFYLSSRSIVHDVIPTGIFGFLLTLFPLFPWEFFKFFSESFFQKECKKSKSWAQTRTDIVATRR